MITTMIIIPVIITIITTARDTVSRDITYGSLTKTKSTVVDDDEDDVYCNEHEWCRNAKAWWNSHADADAVESVTKADSWSSDSSDSGDIGDCKQLRCLLQEFQAGW